MSDKLQTAQANNVGVPRTGVWRTILELSVLRGNRYYYRRHLGSAMADLMKVASDDVPPQDLTKLLQDLQKFTVYVKHYPQAGSPDCKHSGH